uniref:Uncharacterized protein n=1 Tax=Grammatophora oceanica TaxID=210454 RepID=A0A7S1VTM0_9STRA|mmetsp:Transcript_6550/g.9556  ORF Transcript_6550/g.9556 Transcript_6550/m.9556 type:complete len:379 (+) Transcript_6550:119-1255(+)|eukprot:CAMPEP_0194034056 /NCGR_PEP_ID=MMETSP0009_2-20130614/6464_1 /TAXON_ID=210454 /ORGANISM="Grammatophora oceanica, Strain CCMP 410" /LENGTH=378 /DNA_ID=CAMNT_0038674795 /DNA_START=119 /DNA_END=1255 /DNA_ORIENTATION=+
MIKATRILRSQQQEAASRYLLPPRSTWGMFETAGQAAMSLLFSQDDRDDFVETINKGTIRVDVLRQADFGNFLILSLYQDLKSKSFQKTKFQPDQFLKGAKLALEQFHNVKSLLENDIVENPPNGRLVGDAEEKKNSKEEKEDKKTDEEASSDKNDDEMEITHLTLNQTFNVDAAFNMTWAKEAKEDVDSMAGRLQRMVTEEFFKEIEMGSKAGFMMEQSMNKKLVNKEDSAFIENVALISARALVMDDKIDENDTFTIADAEKLTSDASESMAPKEEKRTDETVTTSSSSSTETKTRPVAAQIEVLYDITKTIMVEDAFQLEADEDQQKSETITKTFVFVGIFEGWLQNGKEDDEGVRWKLSQNRPAIEFPTMMPSY